MNIETGSYTEPPRILEDIILFTDEELLSCVGSTLIFDLEVFPNYFLAAFKEAGGQRCLIFEMSPDSILDKPKLRWLFDKFLIVSFNGIKFDMPLIWLAIETVCTNIDLQIACEMLIEGAQIKDIEKQYKYRIGRTNHIDLIEVAPQSASLKIYGGRMHVKKMQDLPFEPGTYLTFEQANEVKHYCINDLDNTHTLLVELKADIELRKSMTIDYGIDLRSKSDAQIAEHVLSSEVKSMTGVAPRRPKFEDTPTFIQYKKPEMLGFESSILSRALSDFCNFRFEMDGGGSPMMPLTYRDKKVGGDGKKYKFKIGETVYTMGMGGMHSNEQSVSHYSDDEYFLVDIDVRSYYPRIILNHSLYPKHIGEVYLQIYNTMVETRLHAISIGNDKAAGSLKVTINGGFGKFGSKWSKLYAPDLLLQVTITGQLSLLMLIERLESYNIPVVSGNTDGIVVKCKKSEKDILTSIVNMWESYTGFSMEYTYYKSIHSRDVNNYFAVTTDGKVKAKGSYGGSLVNRVLWKNPQNLICSTAVKNLLTDNIPIAETIYNCTDIREFVTVRVVRGGAVKDGVTLGKAIRWYYKKDEYGIITYLKNGNKVPMSEGAWPCMELPDTLPTDIDYEWYVKAANEILSDVGLVDNTITLNL